MAQQSFSCQRVRKVYYRRPDSPPKGIPAMPFWKGFIQSEVVVCFAVVGFELLAYETLFQRRNDNAIGKVVQV